MCTSGYVYKCITIIELSYFCGHYVRVLRHNWVLSTLGSVYKWAVIIKFGLEQHLQARKVQSCIQALSKLSVAIFLTDLSEFDIYCFFSIYSFVNNLNQEDPFFKMQMWSYSKLKHYTRSIWCDFFKQCVWITKSGSLVKVRKKPTYLT